MMDQPLRPGPETHGFAAPPPASPGARRMLRIGAAAMLVGLVAIAWTVHSRHRAAAALARETQADAVISVATTRPEPVGGTSELVLPGNLQANYEAPIYARTSGYLKRWLVDIGGRVHKGQLLAEIETPEIDQQLRQARADLAAAQANRAIAEVTAARWKHLRESDSVSKQEADEKISAAEASKAQVDAAEANVRRLSDLESFERITAPFDGVITARNTDIGQLINAGSGSGAELFRIADMTRLRLYVRVPQVDAAAMKPGLMARLRLPDRPGKTHEAKLATTSSAIDPATRTLTAELFVDNASRELLPGEYVEVHFEVPPGAAGRALRLPANVLLFRGDGLHVATVNQHDRVVMKPVAIGRDFGSAIEVVSGLSPQDEVILSPPDSLAEGATVRVVKRSHPEAVADESSR